MGVCNEYAEDWKEICINWYVEYVGVEQFPFYLLLKVANQLNAKKRTGWSNISIYGTEQNIRSRN